MSDSRYNGYTNYPTWRINLEIIGDIEFESLVTEEDLKEIVEDIVFNNTVEKDCLAADYARAFLSNVNYSELAELINYEINETE
jgi:hypothetical protein